MKVLLFLPLAFIAGEHGFAFFAPYLAVCIMMLSCTKWRRKPAVARVNSSRAAPAHIDDSDLRFAQIPA